MALRLSYSSPFVVQFYGSTIQPDGLPPSDQGDGEAGPDYGPEDAPDDEGGFGVEGDEGDPE